MRPFPEPVTQSVRRRAWLLVAMTGLLSCAAHRTDDGSIRNREHALLANVELHQQYFSTAWDAVSSLRSSWLQTRGPDSFLTPSEIQVYLDDVRLGGIETLKNISMTAVVSIERLDANAATARWGIGHGAGALYVETTASRRH